MEALNEFASYRYGHAGAADLIRISIAVRKTGKARRGVGRPMYRVNEGELIDRAIETRLPKYAYELEGPECRGAAGLDLTVEDEKGGRPIHGQEFSHQMAVPAGRLGCPSRAANGFRHFAGLECDSSEVRLAGVVRAGIPDCFAQGHRLFDKGPRSVQIPPFMRQPAAIMSA